MPISQRLDNFRGKTAVKCESRTAASETMWGEKRFQMKLRNNFGKKNRKLLICDRVKLGPKKHWKRGVKPEPGFRAKWWRKAATGHNRDPGIRGSGNVRARCWNWMVFVALTKIWAPESVKTRSALVMTLKEISRRLLVTKLDMCSKVKKATKNKAHMAACGGSEKSKRTNIPCKMWGVMADLRETAYPRKRLAPRNKSVNR